MSSTSTMPGGAGVFGAIRFAAGLTDWLSAWIRPAFRRLAVARLSAAMMELSDEQLAQIGVDRAGILAYAERIVDES